MVELEFEPKSNWPWSPRSFYDVPQLLALVEEDLGESGKFRSAFQLRSMHKMWFPGNAIWQIDLWISVASQGALKDFWDIAFVGEILLGATSPTVYRFCHLILEAYINVQENVLHLLDCEFTKATMALSTCPNSFFTFGGLNILCLSSVTHFNFIIYWLTIWMYLAVDSEL